MADHLKSIIAIGMKLQTFCKILCGTFSPKAFSVDFPPLLILGNYQNSNTTYELVEGLFIVLLRISVPKIIYTGYSFIRFIFEQEFI